MIITKPAVNITLKMAANQGWLRAECKIITLPKKPDNGGIPVKAIPNSINTEPTIIGRSIGMALVNESE